MGTHEGEWQSPHGRRHVCSSSLATFHGSIVVAVPLVHSKSHRSLIIFLTLWKLWSFSVVKDGLGYEISFYFSLIFLLNVLQRVLSFALISA